MRTKTADMSGTGCYIETMLPLPVGKTLSITIWLDSEKINTTAIVRTCDGGVGMGIEFTGLDEQTQNRLQQQVEAMAAESEPSKKHPGRRVRRPSSLLFHRYGRRHRELCGKI